MSITVPQGFRLAGLHCGIKRNASREDLTLVVSDVPAVAAGVYTSNLVFAAPVQFDRSLTPGSGFRAVVINSGNANACTGEQGLADAREMARLAAATCGGSEKQALVMSTGIIGEFMPMEKIRAGLATIKDQLKRDEASLVAAARGMMTTDTVHKLAGRERSLGGRTIKLAGMCKGAAMIGPRMGTMLGLVMTDAPLTPEAAQSALSAVIDDTFNCISVEGHMSTNDTVLLVANGAAGGAPLEGKDLTEFQTALQEICGELARSIPADGEGAKHLVSIEVVGCATRDAARKIARTVADSALVKTAIAGADPNWGRIVSAAGYAGVPFDPAKVELRVNGFLLYQHAAPTKFDAEAVSASIRDNRETQILLSFAEGREKIRFWTTDLTEEYVRLNADYHT